MRRTRLIILSAVVCLFGHSLSVAAMASAQGQDAVDDYTLDGRMPQAPLLKTVAAGLGESWQMDTVFTYPDDGSLSIKAWHTRQIGPALWILSGVHGEESAGPNAIARHVAAIRALSEAGVPVVLIPLANPRAYRNNWRYPNTAERDWRLGGYSVGDSEYLLPDPGTGKLPRAPQAPGPETAALTRYVLRMAETHPPALVLDLHEDELSIDGGYIYSQGTHADANPVGVEIVRALQSSGIRLRMGGETRFGEPILAGVISRDAKGNPIRDGSIDELLSAPEIMVDGRLQAGPSAKTVIVVETPADASVGFEQRVAGQGEVLQRLPALWRLNQSLGD